MQYLCHIQSYYNGTTRQVAEKIAQCNRPCHAIVLFCIALHEAELGSTFHNVYRQQLASPNLIVIALVKNLHNLVYMMCTFIFN